MNTTPDREQLARESFFRDLAHTPPDRVAALADSVSFLTPYERDNIKNTAERMLRERHAKVLKIVDNEFHSLGGQTDRAEAQGKAINAELAQLMAEMESGRVSADGAARRFQELQHQLAKVERVYGDMPRQVESIRVKEADPEAWTQSLEAKYPRIKDGVLGRLSPPTAGAQGPVQWQRLQG